MHVNSSFRAVYGYDQRIEAFGEAGMLISRNRQGTMRLSHLEAAPLKEATGWLADYRDYWTESYARLDELLESLD